MSLNFAQKNAVKLITGPCLILAGAGSGKTKVIINKIVYLIKYGAYKSHNIAAVTFTNKAAYEMRTRLSKHLNILKTKNINISTFHSLGLKIIKHEIKSLRFHDNFTLFDEKDQISLLKKICNKETKNNITLLKKISFQISFWKNQFYTPEKVKSLAKSAVEKYFSDIYEKYNTCLYELNSLDFDDLICLPTTLLKENKEIKNRWQTKITYLLVDEYQDTNNSQYEFIKELTNTQSNFTLVGDDDQSIYSWRGANPNNIFLLKKDFPNLKIIKMEHNYRSSGRILKAANSLISNNMHSLKKTLFSQLQYGKFIQIIIAENEEKEAEKIAKKIFLQCSKKKLQYQDYAILYRGNYQSRILEKVLIKENIPYNISENSSFFSCVEIKDLLSYLRIIINPNDNAALIRIINIPSRKIGSITLKKIEKYTTKQKKSLFDAINDIELEKIINKKTIKKLKDFIDLIQEFIDLADIAPYKILDKIIHDIEYEKWLYKSLKDPKKIQKSINNIYTLSEWLKNMIQGDELEKPMSLSKIITRMTLRDIVTKNTKKQSDNNKVQLMTLHASKGLEFPTVFMIGMCEGVLPNQKSIHNNNIEEERRLTYVGITRAKKQLFFTYCCKIIQYGKMLYTSPSRFLFELPQEDIKWEKNIFKNNFDR
ncbi:ATP-dependent DNA helicase Rep [Buchnera aphidicola (Diuraphis noxia)]|uniref:ATP-dependent DNA helicase Rep n=2 Tax=Buchnera aphidicola TaxID=9 RepID=A0A1B2H9E7_BUCDN|nr:UvrD-helicase domain-containing protein [Buchnera aphidicola]ANZ22768.1 ATP-dependent DNA helicase Rep [Buchnera aphidicola (Diuraphis noxia)]